jgi:hypothetical protein
LDILPEDLSFFTSNQIVDIAKWREDITGSATSGLLSLSQASDSSMSCESEAEVNDTASDYSMDSAYHSQPGTNQRGTMVPEGYQWTYTENSDQPFPYENSSPHLGSDRFTPFSGSQDMDQFHMSPTAAAVDTGAPFEWPANNSMGQEFFNYPSTNVSQFPPMTSPYDMGLTWGNIGTSSLSYGVNQETPQNPTLNTQAQFQRLQNMSPIDTAVRPATMRSASFATQHTPQTPVQPAVFIAPVTTPASAVSDSHRRDSEFGQQSLLDSR